MTHCTAQGHTHTLLLLQCLFSPSAVSLLPPLLKDHCNQRGCVGTRGCCVCVLLQLQEFEPGPGPRNARFLLFVVLQGSRFACFIYFSWEAGFATLSGNLQSHGTVCPVETSYSSISVSTLFPTHWASLTPVQCVSPARDRSVTPHQPHTLLHSFLGLAFPAWWSPLPQQSRSPS